VSRLIKQRLDAEAADAGFEQRIINGLSRNDAVGVTV
jgi:hypothetical protein